MALTQNMSFGLLHVVGGRVMDTVKSLSSARPDETSFQARVAEMTDYTAAAPSAAPETCGIYASARHRDLRCLRTRLWSVGSSEPDSGLLRLSARRL
ncbi:hypothetical protein FKP32DRAFT_1597143 [Trametes sanguinea]|nr:hypothetical protein FKP32DRAFT_1597143 [Trametes sanguinea]